jgi:hypothetical protein
MRRLKTLLVSNNRVWTLHYIVIGHTLRQSYYCITFSFNVTVFSMFLYCSVIGSTWHHWMFLYHLVSYVFLYCSVIGYTWHHWMFLYYLVSYVFLYCSVIGYTWHHWMFLYHLVSYVFRFNGSMMILPIICPTWKHWSWTITTLRYFIHIAFYHIISMF